MRNQLFRLIVLSLTISCHPVIAQSRPNVELNEGASPSTPQYYGQIDPSTRWPQRSTVYVGMVGGNRDLYIKVKDLAARWTRHTNVKFAFDDGRGNFYTWTPGKQNNAHIRISFFSGYNFSLLGKLALKDGTTASMNLETNAGNGTILHEFGHALGFVHEHRRADAPCKFRLYNDRGYRLTASEGFLLPYIRPSGAIYNPGLYTYYFHMTGWSKSQVDAQIIRKIPNDLRIASPFDINSIMMYPFPDFLLLDNYCKGARVSQDLSSTDIAVARTAYPR